MFKSIYTAPCGLSIFVLIVALISSENAAYSQAVTGDSIVSLTLQQAVQLGLKNSYKLKAANLAVEIGNEDVQQKKTDRLPDLSLGITGYLINDPTLYNSGFFQDPEKIDYTPYQVSGNITASQVIYSGNRVKNSISQQVLQKEINAFLAARTTADVKLTVINEYLRLYTLLKDYDVNVKTIDQIELRLKTLRSKFQNGQIVKNDVSRSELQKSDFELKLINTISNASATNYSLALLLGLSGNAIIQVDTTTTYATDTLFVFDDCLATALGNRPEYQIAKTNRELSENTLKIVRGAYLPTVNGIGLYGTQNPVPGTFPPEGKFLTYATVGMGVNYSLASFYKIKHKRTSAALAIQQQIADINDLEISLSEEVRNRLNQYNVQQQSLTIYMKKIRFAEDNYKVVKSRYYNDLALISDMVDAELEYNQARLDLIKGQVQTRMDYYLMLKAIGKL
ncbi:MAG TPA: TolC family protein [Chryseolinea sp.]|nr:TolC family protein [Chryseolinea sp.]